MILRSMFARMPFSFIVFLSSFLSFAVSVVLIVHFSIDNTWTNSTALVSALFFMCSISWTVYDLYLMYRIKREQAIKLTVE
jgi:hypothetical protein